MFTSKFSSGSIICNTVKTISKKNLITSYISLAHNDILKRPLSFCTFARTKELLKRRISPIQACVTTSLASANDTSTGLTHQQAFDLAIRLSAGDRKTLLTALQGYEAKLVKDEYEEGTKCKTRDVSGCKKTGRNISGEQSIRDDVVHTRGHRRRVKSKRVEVEKPEEDPADERTGFGLNSIRSTWRFLFRRKKQNDPVMNMTGRLVKGHLHSSRVTAIRAVSDGIRLHRLRGAFVGQLAAHRWRSKFGRPSKIPKLGDVDPSGLFCPVPEVWMKERFAAATPTPSAPELVHLSVANSIPFIGFGFLDNFIMIVAGDSIDHVLGSYICLSTMAAAALGNTLSDVVGIGSAYYVERFAEKTGFQAPGLTPVQLDLPICRRASNLGRVLGITVGCLIGMLPLLFMKEDPKPKEKTQV